MAGASPTFSGIRAAFRTPSLWLAEVAWRWSFAIGAGMLILLSLFEFLRTQPIAGSQERFLQSQNFLLVATALSSIFADSGQRLLLATAILAPALVMLWIMAATLGRAATLRFLVSAPALRFRGLLAITFLRAVVGLVAIGSLGGIAVVVGHVAGPLESSEKPLALLLLFALVGFAAWAWTVSSWALSLASVFTAYNRRTAWGAIADALRLIRDRTGRLFAIGSWFCLLRLVLVGAALLSAGLAARLGSISAPFATVAILLIWLLCLAGLDFLRIARLAAYVQLAEQP